MTEEEVRKIFKKELLAYTNLLLSYIDRMKPDDTPRDVVRKLRFKLNSQLEDL